MMKKLFTFLMLLKFAVLPSQAQQIYYAAPNANGGGSSWSDAGDLETMLSLAPDGAQVWVMHGFYNIGSSIIIDRSLSVYGGFEGNENTLEERGLITHNYSILYSSQTAISSTLCVNIDPYSGTHPIVPSIAYFELDGFNMQNANIQGWGGALRAESVDELILKNVLVENCQANNGGGMYIENIPMGHMENVLFINNFANNFGGGLFVSDCDNFVMVNTAFIGNQADCNNSPTGGTNTYGSDGFFFEYSNIMVHYMSVTLNEYGKGGCIALSTVHFNNIISYPDSINIEYNHQDTVYYNHCCLWTTDHLRLQGKVYINNCSWDPGNMVIENNIISANPLFDLFTYYPYPYLQSGSPCIDAGTASYGLPYDLFGLPRHAGNDVDMGAMEYQGQ